MVERTPTACKQTDTHASGAPHRTKALACQCNGMSDPNVHHTESSSRDDLEHTDTVSSGGADDIQPAGYEQSISPVGEVPPAGERADLPADETPSIGERTGHDPNNLGDDIPDQGDLVHPAPANAPVGKTPTM
jgi:hypothetical protein